MKKGGYLYLFFVLLHFSCKFVPYFAPAGAILNIYTDRSRIETGGDKAIITVLGFTEEGAPLRDYTRVLLSASIGTIPPYIDLVDGKAITEFVSGTQRGQAEIIARSGIVITGTNNTTAPNTAKLTIQVGPGDLAYLNIKANPVHLDPGGGRSEITVYAYDVDNRPLPGILVQLTTNPGYFEISGNPHQTDANGACRNWLLTKATATVTASVGTTIKKEITVSVEINEKPTPKFFYTPKFPKGTENVFFNASESTDADGYIVSYTWYFGDGGTGSGKIVTHNYEYEGLTDKIFSVILQVTDNFGAIAIAKEDVTIKVNISPTPKFSYSPKVPKGKENISFDASASFDIDGSIDSYDWDFGDGTTTSGKIVTHNYEYEGLTDKIFSVILQVTDNFGAKATTTQDVTVSPDV